MSDCEVDFLKLMLTDYNIFVVHMWGGGDTSPFCAASVWSILVFRWMIFSSPHLCPSFHLVRASSNWNLEIARNRV